MFHRIEEKASSLYYVSLLWNGNENSTNVTEMRTHQEDLSEYKSWFARLQRGKQLADGEEERGTVSDVVQQVQDGCEHVTLQWLSGENMDWLV